MQVHIARIKDGLVVEAMPDSKAKTLWVVSAYATKIKEEGGQVPKWSEAPSRVTSETPLASYNQPSSTTSIPENSETRNRQNSQNRQENSGNQYQLSEDIEGDEDADIAALSGGENGLLIRVSPVRAWQGQPTGNPRDAWSRGFCRSPKHKKTAARKSSSPAVSFPVTAR